MNTFQTFQPSKQKTIGTAVQFRQLKEASKSKQPHQANSLKDLLLRLNNDSFNLSVSVDAKSAAPKHTYTSTKKSVVQSTEALAENHNPVLYRQINIEANFDITPLLRSDPITRSCSYIYPASLQPVENYGIVEYIAENIGKPKHWVSRETELPYLDSGSHMTLGSGLPSSSLMLGTATTTSANSSNSQQECALQATQSRLLKWQESLHSLLRRLLQAENASTEHTQNFYVLGRSVTQSPPVRGAGAAAIDGLLPLPYTSAYFYNANISNDKPSKRSGKVISDCLKPTIATCIIIGVQKAMLTRLQQLGAKCYLLEDANTPVLQSTSTKTNSGLINLTAASTRSSQDPHASTSALFNSKKLGVDILVSGNFAVSIVAQVLLETVFACIKTGAKGANVDVPVLCCSMYFPHALGVSCDKRPVQCQHVFSNPNTTTVTTSTTTASVLEVVGSTTDSMNNTSLQENSNLQKADEKTAVIDYPVHKLQLTGLLRAEVLQQISDILCDLAQKADVSSTRRSISSAYTAVTQRGSNPLSVSNTTALQQGAQTGNLSALRPLSGSSLTQSSTQPPPLNPMTLVTANARNYATITTAETSAESESDSEPEQDEATRAKQREEGVVPQMMNPMLLLKKKTAASAVMTRQRVNTAATATSQPVKQRPQQAIQHITSREKENLVQFPAPLQSETTAPLPAQLPTPLSAQPPQQSAAVVHKEKPVEEENSAMALVSMVSEAWLTGVKRTAAAWFEGLEEPSTKRQSTASDAAEADMEVEDMEYYAEGDMQEIGEVNMEEVEAAVQAGGAGDGDSSYIDSLSEAYQSSARSKAFSDNPLSKIPKATSVAVTAKGVPVSQTPAAEDYIRADQWLKQHRQDTTKYFILQCSLLTPRVVQFSYSNVNPLEPVVVEKRVGGVLTHRGATTGSADATQLLAGKEVVEEVRWSQQTTPTTTTSTTTPSKRTLKKSRSHVEYTVEVIVTVPPPVRMRGLTPAPPRKGTAGVGLGVDDEQDDELETGLVLDALNKYSVYVDTKQL